MHTGSEQSVTGGEFEKFLKHYQLSKHFENFWKGWGWDRLTEDQFGTAQRGRERTEREGAVSRIHMSTPTECQPEAVVSSLLHVPFSRLSEPDDWRGVPALLQSAMDHIVTLDGRLDALHGTN